MKKEWNIFLTAVMYLTRIRVPARLDHRPEYLQRCAKYAPLVGWIVGGISSLVFLVFSKYISTDIGILASMIAGVLTTGAFHEDGFADVCDGFGGGWTKEKILLIMKDSRIGAFGAIGLLAILGSKFLLLKELSAARPFILLILVAHSLSRLMPVLVMRRWENVTDPEHSKSKPLTSGRFSPGELALSIVFALAPFAFLPRYFMLAILPVAVATYAMAKYFKKWIGGYTGDCLGAIQQVTEGLFYLGAIFIWKYT